jgi:hypothetical protein
MAKDLKQRILKELSRFSMYFIFLALFLCSIISYSNLLLGEYEITYFRYGYGILEAFILAKIIILGETFQLGERFRERSLVIPTLYKTILFTVFATIFTIAEHFLKGFLHGEDLSKVLATFLDKGLDIDIAMLQMVFLVFLLFFAFMETARVLGENKLFRLFFHRKSESNRF